MNKATKAIVSLAQALLLVLALTINSFAAQQSLAYNVGARHEECISLSDAAGIYYTDYTYEELAGQSSSQLLNSLRQLMKSTHRYSSTYSDCRDMASKIDSAGIEGQISLIYSSAVVTRADFGGNTGTWNREHVWPKSLGGFGNSGAGSDLHHIRPSDATMNSARGNLKFGNATGGTSVKGSSLVSNMVAGTRSGAYFEPLDNVKGDVARICLYVYVRYGEELSKCNDITNVFESVDVLLEWCELDPVDEWEMGRNDVVEGIQGNRNVFIDYPEYAWLMFDKEIPDDMSTPSGKAMQGGSGAAGDECTHEFDDWVEVTGGEMMRMCALCSKLEFAPLDESLLGGTLNDNDKNDKAGVVFVIGALVLCAGVVTLVSIGVLNKRKSK